MPKMSWSRALAGAAVSAAVGLSSIVMTSPAAHAEVIETATECANPFTGSQAGPSSFSLTAPTTIHVGDSVPIQFSFTFVNNSGFPITDLNSFSMPGATPVALTAGSQGAVANGGSVTVAMTGTWSPTAKGAQTIAATSSWTFNTIAFGLTIPVTCTFTSAPPSITRTVTPLPTLAVSTRALKPKQAVRVSGSYWAPSARGTVSLCKETTSGTAQCAAIGTVKTSAKGKLCGSGRIPARTAAGKYQIKVTVGSDSKAVGISVRKGKGGGKTHH